MAASAEWTQNPNHLAFNDTSMLFHNQVNFMVESAENTDYGFLKKHLKNQIIKGCKTNTITERHQNQILKICRIIWKEKCIKIIGQ